MHPTYNHPQPAPPNLPAAWTRCNYMKQACQQTEAMAHYMLLPSPSVFSYTLPVLKIATIIVTVVITSFQAALSIAAFASSPSRRLRRLVYLPAASSLNTLLFLLTLWLAAMFAITALYVGVVLVAEKATADAVVTLQSVDPTIRFMLGTMANGAFQEASGFNITVGPPKVSGCMIWLCVHACLGRALAWDEANAEVQPLGPSC